MPNALQQNNTPPPAPNPNSQDQNGLISAPMNSGPSPMAQQGGQQAPPQPSHAETVAALRHFDAIKKELQTLLKIETLGKADIKSQIIEGTTQLVGNRIITPAQAVMQLATVPTSPADQKKWVETHFMQTMQAENAVLDHHRAGQPGLGNYDIENAIHEPEGEQDHIGTMAGMMNTHYGNG